MKAYLGVVDAHFFDHDLPLAVCNRGDTNHSYSVWVKGMDEEIVSIRVGEQGNDMVEKIVQTNTGEPWKRSKNEFGWMKQ